MTLGQSELVAFHNMYAHEQFSPAAAAHPPTPSARLTRTRIPPLPGFQNKLSPLPAILDPFLLSSRLRLIGSIFIPIFHAYSVTGLIELNWSVCLRGTLRCVGENS